jgi:hypothetical protein
MTSGPAYRSDTVSGTRAGTVSEPRPPASGVELPAVSLPRGGGAIRGIDEKFSVTQATGTASLSVPIATSTGRAGFGPSLTLEYDSGAGNGPFGLGWSLPIPAIGHRTAKGIPRYVGDEESDTFVLAGSEDLAPLLVKAAPTSNGWTAGHELVECPPADGVATLTVLDLLGSGTSCLVWASSLPADDEGPTRYIELTGSVKPHLLTTITNNRGAVTTLRFAPSTRFYLADRAAGDAWVTRLPFPVHVVERVQTADAISRISLVSTYSYHHGFYDDVEREFRGFARVEQRDADTLPKASGVGAFTATPAVEGEDFTLPPVLTRTWFHTGAYFDREDIATHLRTEFYALDPQAPKLGPTALPADAGATALREACRALRGKPLREEVYALDGAPAAAHPYSATEHRYRVDRLQPPTASAPGTYLAWEAEHVACTYERDPAGPRISHELTLAVDPFGTPPTSALGTSVAFSSGPSFGFARAWVGGTFKDLASDRNSPMHERTDS